VKGKLTVLVAGACALLLIPAASAAAATVTIGSPLTSAFTNLPAGGVGTNAMVSGPNLASPVDGTVVGWRTQGFTGTMRVRILTVGAGNAATATASSPLITLSGGTVDTPVSLPIKQGQLVGFDNTNEADRADIASPSAAYVLDVWDTLPDNGSPQTPVFSNDIEFAYNATVRYCVVPKLTGKKVGAAGTALANAGCRLGKVTKKKGKKGKGKKVVRSQSVLPGTSLGDQAPVDVVVKKKKKHRKK